MGVRVRVSSSAPNNQIKAVRIILTAFFVSGIKAQYCLPLFCAEYDLQLKLESLNFGVVSLFVYLPLLEASILFFRYIII